MKIIKAFIKAILPLIGIGIGMVVLAGCATKTRSVQVDGMFTEAGAGLMAIGSVDVMAAPIAEETAFVRYEEDNAWLQPSMKLHKIQIMQTGTNSVENMAAIVKSICNAFISASTNTAARASEPLNR